MTISSEQFKDVLRFFASGVTIVTSARGAERHGMTVSAFVSVSADPPLVAVLIEKSTTLNLLLDGDDPVFAVNLLAAEQVELSNRFAFEKDEDRFLVGKWMTAVTGAPVLADALAWLDCRLERRHEAGSHNLYIGAVEAVSAPRPEAPPLIYWNREYRYLDAL